MAHLIFFRACFLLVLLLFEQYSQEIARFVLHTINYALYFISCCSIFNDRSPPLPHSPSGLSLSGQLYYITTSASFCQAFFANFFAFFAKIFVWPPLFSRPLHYTTFYSYCQELFRKIFLFVNFALIFGAGFAHSRQNLRKRSKYPYLFSFFTQKFFEKRSKIR